MNKNPEQPSMKTIGRFEVKAEIGRGGMSVVYQAYEPTLKRLVALKVVSPHLAGQPRIVSRLRHEAISAARLRHPNIAMLYEFGEEDGQAFLAMEYFPGVSLRQLLETGPLPFESALNILNQIGQALDYAHSVGVVHRDVKPSNILVDENGRAMLVDFGLADMTDNSLITPDGVVMGTPHYMAPEQAAGHNAVDNSDQYSLATVAYEMLTGAPPFHYNNTAAVVHAHIYELPPPPTEIAPHLPLGVNSVLLKALAKTPEDRYPSLAAFLHNLQSALQPPTTPPKTNRRPWLWLVLGAAGLALLALFLVAALSPAGLQIGTLSIGRKPTPPLPQQVVWNYDPGFVARSEPVAVDDSLVVGSSNGQVAVLKAIDGSLRWQTNSKDIFLGEPSADSDLVFVGNDQEVVQGLSLQSGGPVWSTKVYGKIRMAPVLYQDRLIVITSKGYLYLLQAGNGRMIWNRPFVETPLSPVAGRSMIFISAGSTLYALDIDDGRIIWEYTSSSPLSTHPAVIGENVVAGDEQGLLHILNIKDGSEQWVYQARGALKAAPAVSIDATRLFIPDQSGLVTALDVNKKEIAWKFKAGAAVESTPLLYGSLIFGANNAVVYILNPDNGQPLGTISLGATVESSPVTNGSFIFVRADQVYALKP